MKNITKMLPIVILLLIVSVKPVYAKELVVSASAKTITITNDSKYDYRLQKLKNYLQNHNSPLSKYSGEFIESADKYGLDWRLVVSISGVESTFGKRIPYNSYNAYGWANGNYYFQSWEDSIDHVSKYLKDNYIDKGADTVDEIAPIYAPPSSSWGWKVKYFMSEIDAVPLRFTL